jgi:UDP-glucuronate 4-epimerase
MQKIVITGAYGFLGYSLAVRLLKQGHIVYGIDKVTKAVSPKAARIENLAKFENFKGYDVNLANFDQVRTLFELLDFTDLVHMAAQYSVMHTTEHALSYAEGNLTAFVNMLEAVRLKRIRRVLYASSTFVQDGVLPTSMYGATKDFNEKCAHVYSAQFGLETVGLRFGSTYGPYIRPDVGIYQLARRLYAGQTIDVTAGGFNYKTAFVYVADAVECMVRFLVAPLPRPWVVSTIVAEDALADLDDVLQLLEQYAGLQAVRVGTLGPRQGFCVPTAECRAVADLIGYNPSTKLSEGLAKFIEWFGPRYAAGKV